MDLEVLTMLLFAVFFYFLPSIIGGDKKRFAGIFVLNLFLGWTVLGWIASLIWAVSDTKKEKHYG